MIQLRRPSSTQLSSAVIGLLAVVMGALLTAPTVVRSLAPLVVTVGPLWVGATIRLVRGRSGQAGLLTGIGVAFVAVVLQGPLAPYSSGILPYATCGSVAALLAIDADWHRRGGRRLFVLVTAFIVLFIGLANSAAVLLGGQSWPSLRWGAPFIVAIPAAFISWDENKARLALFVVTFGSTCYMAAHLGFRLLGGLAGVGLSQPYGHESVSVMALAVASWWVQRRLLMTSIMLILMFMFFLNYPAFTYVVAAVVIAVWIVLTDENRNRRHLILFCGLIVSLCFAYVSQVVDLQAALQDYYDGVGKFNSSGVRFDFLGQVIERLSSSPWFGSWGQQAPTVTLRLGGNSYTLVSPHSDILTMALIGGVVLAALFVVFLALPIIRGVRTLGKCPPRASWPGALSATCLAGFSVFAAGQMANPTIEQTSVAVVAMMCAGFVTSMRTVEESADERDLTTGSQGRSGPARERLAEV